MSAAPLPEPHEHEHGPGARSDRSAFAQHRRDAHGAGDRIGPHDRAHGEHLAQALAA